MTLTNLAIDLSDDLAWAALLVAVLGLVISAFALWDALEDHAAVVRTGANGARRIVSRAGIRREISRLVVQLCLGVIAYVTVKVQPVPASMPAEIVYFIGLRNLLRFFLAILIAATSVWDRIDRYRLVAALIVQHRLDRWTPDREGVEG